jgi:hypothetical protein
MGKISVALNQVILEAALQGLEDRKNKLNEQIAQVHSLLRHRRIGRQKIAHPARATANVFLVLRRAKGLQLRKRSAGLLSARTSKQLPAKARSF